MERNQHKRKEFARELENRTRKFGVSILKLASSLPINIEAKIVRNQIAKSGTSIGANYREANRSRSKADFLNKIRISESEASETIYWLEIIEDMNWNNSDKFDEIKKESKEILALFTAISYKLKRNIVQSK